MMRLRGLLLSSALLFVPAACGLNPQPEPPIADPTFGDMMGGGIAGGDLGAGAENNPPPGATDAGRNGVPVSAPDFGAYDAGAPADAGSDAAP